MDNKSQEHGTGKSHDGAVPHRVSIGSSPFPESEEPTSAVNDGHPPLERTKATLRFVELLTGNMREGIHWRLFHDSDRKVRAFSEFGLVYKLMDKAEPRQSRGYGVFMVINGGGQRDAHIETIRAVFIDADDVPMPDSWHIEPHFIVPRDETHWHAYWLPERYADRSKIEHSGSVNHDIRALTISPADLIALNPAARELLRGILHTIAEHRGEIIEVDNDEPVSALPARELETVR